MIGHHRQKGHSLLETIIAAGIFVIVAVALSAVWVTYGRALAKASENLAANHLARSVTEGLIANGYDWLYSQYGSGMGGTLPQEELTLKRTVRGQSADITYNVTHEVTFNRKPDGTLRHSWLSGDVCQITVSVRWHSPVGGRSIEGGTYNNEINYSAYAYRGALN